MLSLIQVNCLFYYSISLGTEGQRPIADEVRFGPDLKTLTQLSSPQTCGQLISRAYTEDSTGGKKDNGCEHPVCKYNGSIYPDWLISMLLVSRSRLVEDNAKVFHHYGFHFSSTFSCKFSSPFRENYNCVVFPFPFHTFMLMANLWFIRLQE